MALGPKFPWQVAAFFTLVAVVLQSVAIGLPLWSKAHDTSGAEYEYGMWKNCYTGICSDEVPLNGPCRGDYLSFKVLALFGACFAFIALLVLCLAAAKGASMAIAALACCILFLAFVFCMVGWIMWLVISRKESCYNTKVENWDASFIMSVVATALLFTALCLAIFGLLWAKKKPKHLQVVQENVIAEEPMYYPVVQQYPTVMQESAPQAGFYSSYPTTTYPVV
jgi:hypothetical protein